jgi:tripartite-type tricarboxylate transporter receptor subunit TctC
LRVLAIEGKENVEVFPGSQSFEDLGYEPGIGATFGIILPKGTPPEIVRKLQDALKRASLDPRYQESCKKVGLTGLYRSGEEYLAEIKQTYVSKGSVLKELGLAKAD